MAETILVGLLLIVVTYFVNDYLKNIFPHHLRKLAWKRLNKLNLNQDTKELIYQGFINDCENQKSSIKEYQMIAKFIFTFKDTEIPTKAEDKES